MQKELNHKVRKCFNEGIYNVARYTEIVLSIIILIVIALAGIRLIFTITEIQIMDMDIDFFTTFLANGLSLVVGVEFVKMLCRHSAQTVVEVLMFATARLVIDLFRYPADAGRSPDIEPELLEDILFRRIFDGIPIRFPDAVDLYGMAQGRVRLVPVRFVRPVFLMFQPIDHGVKGGILLPAP